LPIDAEDSINFHELVNKPVGNNKFFINFAMPAPRNKDTSTVPEFKDSKPAPLENDEPGEKRRLHAHTTSGHGKKPWPAL